VRHGDVGADGVPAREAAGWDRRGLPPRGILGTVFTGRLLEETRVGDRAAVVPQITGQAWITGIADYVVDPTDPFPDGFTVGDIWA
jgi:proline racemase